MPYKLEPSGSGFYVVGPSGRRSRRPLPRARAEAQLRALYRAEKEAPSATPSPGNASGPGGLFSASALEKRGTRAYPRITIKEHGDSAMIAFYLPAEAAADRARLGAALFGVDAEKADDLHITVAYLGKVADIEPQLVEIAVVLQEYVRMWQAQVGTCLEITLGDVDYFPTIQDSGRIPVYYAVNSDSLVQWVDGLRKLLEGSGLPFANDFGTYTPHVTIAYVPPGTAIPQGALLPVEVTIDSVVLAIGETHIELPLNPSLVLKAEAPESSTPDKKKPGASAPSGAEPGGGGGGLPAGVIRVRGNLCHVHGKFGPCNKATPTGFSGKTDKKPKGGKGSGGGKKDPAAREAERAKQQAANRESVKQGMADADQGLSPSGFDSLSTLAEGGVPDKAHVDGLMQMGLVEQGGDGVIRLSSAGRAAMNAANHGDTKGAIDAISRGSDAASGKRTRETEQEQKRQEREATAAQRKADQEARVAERQKLIEQRKKDQAKRSGGGGSGGGDKIDPQQARAQERQARQDEALGRAGLSSETFADLQAAATGEATKPNDDLVKLGLVEVTEDGVDATDAGRQAMRALQRGDIVGYRAALQNARQKLAKQRKTDAANAPEPAYTPPPVANPPKVHDQIEKSPKKRQTTKEYVMPGIALKMILDDTLQAELNGQIGRELFAQNAYRSVASWADSMGFPGFQQWAQRAAAEEATHADSQIDYLNDRGTVQMGAIPAPTHAFDSMCEALKYLWELEKIVSAALTRLVQTARALGDETTAIFIGSFLDEQRKAENELRKLVIKASRDTPVDVLDSFMFGELDG